MNTSKNTVKINFLNLNIEKSSQIYCEEDKRSPRRRECDKCIRDYVNSKTIDVMCVPKEHRLHYERDMKRRYLQYAIKTFNQHFYGMKVLPCNPDGEHVKDLTRECVEPNPGPVTFSKICLVCGDLDIITSIMEKYVCNGCLSGYAKQGFLTTETSANIESNFNKFVHFIGDGDHLGNSFLEHYINIPDDMCGYVSLIEDTLILIYGLLRCRNAADRYVAIVNYCKLRGCRPGFVQIILYIVGDLFGSLAMQQFKKDPLYDEILERVEYEPQSASDDDENVFGKLRYYLGFYNKLKETAIYKKVYKMMLYLLATEMLGTFITFDSLNFDAMEAAAYRRTHKVGVDMLHCVLDTVLFICERGTYFIKTGDVSAIFHSGSTYEKWYMGAHRLAREHKYLSNPEPHGVNRFEYLNRLKDTIEKGISIQKFGSDLDKYEKLSLGKLLNELQMIESAELTRKAAQMPRKDPFAVLIHGSSSICKSQLKQILFYHYGKIFKHPVSADYMYTRCPTDEFWSGFNSTQWCIVMDDIAFLKPNGEVDPTLKEMLQVKNSVPYCPPQADLADKGRTPVRAELLIGTTNTKHLNLHAYFACPFAIARRLSYIITAEIKPEFAKHSIMADSQKIPVTPEGEYMNIWNFKISIPVPETEENVDAQGTRYKQIAAFADIADLLVWYIEVAKQHEVSQAKAMAADNTMMNVDVCDTCYLVRRLCICAPSEHVEDRTEAYEPQVGSWDDSDDDESNLSPIQQSPPLPLSDIEKELLDGEYSILFKLQVALISKILEGSRCDIFDWISAYSWVYNHKALCCLVVALWYIFPLSFKICVMLFTIVLIYEYLWLISQEFCKCYYGGFWKLRLAHRIVGCDYQAWRLIWRTKGKNIKAKYFTNKNLLKFAGFLTGAVATTAMYKMCRMMINEKWDKREATRMGDLNQRMKPEQIIHVVNHNEYSDPFESQGNVGVTPVPLVQEKPAFYQQDPYVLTPVDISPQSKQTPEEVLMNKLGRNTAKCIFRFTDSDIVHSTTCVNVKGNCWLVNQHTFAKTQSRTGTIEFIVEPTTQNVSRNVKSIAFSNKDIRYLKGTDIAMIQIRALPPGPSLYEYFAKKDFLRGCFNGVYTLKSKTGCISHTAAVNISVKKCPVFGVQSYHSTCYPTTKNGDCGSLLLIRYGSTLVLGGIHVAGNESTGGAFAQLVTQERLDALLSDYSPQVDCGDMIPISAKGALRSIKDVDPKCALRWLESGTATIYGSFEGYRPRHKSHVKKTFICDLVKEDGYVADFGPPDMSWQPWNKAIIDMVAPNHVFHNETIDECASAFLSDILRELPAGSLDMVEMYTQDVALNGVDGIAFVDRINIRTSAGNPFKKTKLNFMKLTPEFKVESIDSTIQERIDQIEACYDKGMRFHPQFNGTLKDEALPMKKILAGKTRLFTGGEMAWCVVVRKTLLSHIRLIQNNPYVFEAMPGIVAQSTEWGDLYNYLTKFGKDKIIAGDYGKFDKKMAAPFILAAFSILRGIAEKAGWSKEDLTYIDCISYDTAFPCIDFNGDLIEIQGNPSGHPLTVIINCLVNSLYMRYAFKLISGKPVTDFRKYVNLATYGDDNIMGVSDLCPNFNHTRIAIAMKAIGVEYTMAEKEAASIPYINISESSFLKRKFVWDADLGAIAAPLDESSFNKMLTAYVETGQLSPQAHSVCAIETALREYFYYGKSKFEERSLYFRGLIARANLQDWVRESTFPSYESIAYSFWMRYGDEKMAKKFIQNGDHTPKQAASLLDSHDDDNKC